MDHGLHYQRGSVSLNAFCDADWAGNPGDRRSSSGFGIFLGQCLVSWSSKKQSVVSRSCTEAEYRSLALIIYLLTPTIWCDNLSAISLESNPIFHARTKHIEVDYHFIREKVVNKDVVIRHINTANQVADIFTKGHTADCFCFLREKLLVCSLPASLREGVKDKEVKPNLVPYS